ncbi:MAG: ECF transporter S component [Lachnospiraceae bacterium]|nr:ECF transporter S component [Lachnospiraceae bacterium]
MSETTQTKTLEQRAMEIESTQTTSPIRMLAGTGMLSAVAFILMFLDFSVPIMPSFIKMDLSELPALIAGFAYGPISGVCVCLIKNLLHLTITSTGGVGELCNFLLGVTFVLPASFIYRAKKTKKTALIGSLIGAVVMGIFSIAINYYLTYPVYYNFMPKETILEAYQLILPGMKSILQCLVVFNAPFTFVKGLCSVIITLVIYKPLSPILKGHH